MRHAFIPAPIQNLEHLIQSDYTNNWWLQACCFGRSQALTMHNYHIYADKYVTRDVITPYASVTNTTMSVISKVTKNAACE